MDVTELALTVKQKRTESSAIAALDRGDDYEAAQLHITDRWIRWGPFASPNPSRTVWEVPSPTRFARVLSKPRR